MSIHFSPSVQGFFDTNIVEFDFIPKDAVEVSEDDYKTILDGQSPDKVISIVDGKVSLVPAPPPNSDFLEAQAKAHRVILLEACDWTQLRDTKTSKEWTEYRQALRDITKQEGYPQNIVWPTAPQT